RGLYLHDKPELPRSDGVEISASLPGFSLHRRGFRRHRENHRPSRVSGGSGRPTVVMITSLNRCEEFLAGDHTRLRELLNPSRLLVAFRYSLAIGRWESVRRSMMLCWAWSG